MVFDKLGVKQQFTGEDREPLWNGAEGVLILGFLMLGEARLAPTCVFFTNADMVLVPSLDMTCFGRSTLRPYMCFPDFSTQRRCFLPSALGSGPSAMPIPFCLLRYPTSA